jgi:hypothetical protein
LYNKSNYNLDFALVVTDLALFISYIRKIEQCKRIALFSFRLFILGNTRLHRQLIC